ncbi:hypothetical protein [Methylosinus sp. Sm6]|uniref:hypothetical protein n=1 Tax=Methylosinus sp. Sm6 TaxID=2866948 RepID=UPI001C98F282|nr:hypothetical protein [Methylosinus sp. Sm6]MBY6239849.1 hypothetical protein [Methylosinus sp. Sm6]
MSTVGEHLQLLAKQVSEIETLMVGFERARIADEADGDAYRNLARAVRSLAGCFGLECRYDDDDDETFRDGVEFEELDAVRSLLLRRAIPEFLDGLPDAVQRHYASQK